MQCVRNGYDLALGIGIAQGFATLGQIGFGGRLDYAAIGSVTNLTARLCGNTGPWQVLVTDRVLAAVEDICESDLVGDVQPKGFSRSVRVHNIDTITAIDERGGHDMTDTQLRPLSLLDEVGGHVIDTGVPVGGSARVCVSVPAVTGCEAIVDPLFERADKYF